MFRQFCKRAVVVLAAFAGAMSVCAPASAQPKSEPLLEFNYGIPSADHVTVYVAQDLGLLSLRVPPPGQDADTVIRELVERAPRAAELIVVTSDKALYSYVKTLGASVLRAHEWNNLERDALSRARRASSVSGSEKPVREEDVEGWLKKFGGSE